MPSPMSFSSLQHKISRDPESVLGPVSLDFSARLAHENLSALFVLTTSDPPRQVESLSTTSDFVLDPTRCKRLGSSNLRHPSRQFPALMAVSKTSTTRLQLQCPFANCPQKFERASDLQRHGESFHITHPCLVRGCSRNQRGFCRRDKLIEHLRKEHPNFFVLQGQLEQLPIDQVHNRAEIPASPRKPYTLRRKLLAPRRNKWKKSSTVKPVSTKSPPRIQGLTPNECLRTRASICVVMGVKRSTDEMPREGTQREQETLEELQSQPADSQDIRSDERPRSRDSNEDMESNGAAKLADGSMKESPIYSRTTHTPISPITESDECSEMDSDVETITNESDLYNCLLENPEQFLADDLDFPIPAFSRQDLIERIMDEFWMVFNHEWPSCTVRCAGSSPASSSDANRQSTRASSPKEQSRWKRKKDENDNDHHEKRDEDDQGDTPSKKKSRNGSVRRHFRFACPFRKHNPTKYNVIDHRICALNPWDNVARLKEHLYRKHMAVPYCGRCWQSFENSDQLSAHINLPRADVCEAIEGRPPEGVTSEQERSLRRKGKSYPNQSEESRWRGIYIILFPGEHVPPPHFDPPREQITTTPNSQSLDEYESHMREQLPELIRSRVEQHLDASILRGLDFGGIIRECQEELSRTYREAARGSSTSQMMSLEPGQSEESTAPLDSIPEISESLPRHNSEFVCEVLLVPPPQADSQILDPSLEATIRDSKSLCAKDQSSDSGYASINTSTGHCRWQRNSTSSQITTTATSNPGHLENFAGHIDTEFSLQVASREARNPTPDTSSHTQYRHPRSLFNSQPIAGDFEPSIEPREQALGRSSISDSATRSQPEGDHAFNPPAHYQHQPELSAFPLFQNTGYSTGPSPMQLGNDLIFATSTQEDGPSQDISWQDAIGWGLFNGPAAPNGF